MCKRPANKITLYIFKKIKKGRKQKVILIAIYPIYFFLIIRIYALTIIHVIFIEKLYIN